MVILIADDDRLVRFTVKSMLREILGESETIFLEASNGRDMVKICHEKEPDVAFVDIKMPYLDGLDAIAESKSFSETTEYVIISGYSDFTYAQRGIHLGVNEYLLKPIDEEQLQKVVEILKEKQKARKRESNSRFQFRVLEAFNSYSVIETEEQKWSYSKNNYKYLGFVVYVKTGVYNQAASMQIQKHMIKDIQRFGEEVVAQKGYYGISSTNEGFPCIVFYTKKELQEFIVSAMKKITTFAARKDRTVFQYILWFERQTLEEVCQACEEMSRETYMGMNYCPGYLYAYKEESIDHKDRELLKLIEQLMDSWEMADGMACKEIMNKLWCSYKDEKIEVNLKNISQYCSFITGCRIESDSLKSFCKSIVEQSDKMYRKVERKEIDMIESVKKYIQKYYMNDISISQIAEHYELTANYFSTVFHRKTGRKFIDYLTQVRMEASKRLLIQNGSASVQDIALMVGYNSARHFSSLFQKTTGETPTEYRKKRL